jgi:hypothetical protein
MSSIPNSVMPNAQSINPGLDATAHPTFDRLLGAARSVPTGAWMAGAAALGVAAAAAATLWEKAPLKKSSPAPRRARRKTATGSRRRAATA